MRAKGIYLAKDPGLEIDGPSNTIMVNVNRKCQRPLKSIIKVPLNIQGRIVPSNAVIVEADSYSTIVENNWLRKTRAKINYKNSQMLINWNRKELNIPIENKK